MLLCSLFDDDDDTHPRIDDIVFYLELFFQKKKKSYKVLYALVPNISLVSYIFFIYTLGP